MRRPVISAWPWWHKTRLLAFAGAFLTLIAAAVMVALFPQYLNSDWGNALRWLVYSGFPIIVTALLALSGRAQRGFDLRSAGIAEPGKSAPGEGR